MIVEDYDFRGVPIIRGIIKTVFFTIKGRETLIIYLLGIKNLYFHH